MYILKKSTLKKNLSILAAVGLTLTFTAMQVFASVSPESLSTTLAPGESVSETKTVVIPELPAKADIVFCFDLTGSMGPLLAAAQAGALSIMSQLDSTGVDIHYGVISHMDYPFFPYGVESDYPYRLDQALTTDNDAVSSTINGLTIGNGWDSPESYTRALYESYSDSNILWRTDAKKIVITFGDNVPHDNDINEGVPGTMGVLSTGIDPGRDCILGTPDDLDLQTVLGGMSASNVTLLSCQAYGAFLNYWSYWSGLTGGSAYSTDSGTLAADVTAAITSALTVTQVSGLTLKASAGFESWLTSVNPADYSGPAGSTAIFDILITVPEGTPDGVYDFTIDAVDSANVNYGSQSVSITVIAPNPVIQIVKTTNGSDGLTITAGVPVVWHYEVTNPGNVPLMNVVVSDDKGIVPVYVTGDDGDGLLQPGEIWIYEVSGTAAAGQYDNIGRVDAMSQRETVVYDTDASSYFGAAPGITLVKTAKNVTINGAAGKAVTGTTGDDFLYTIVVTNSGNVDLSSVIITDSKAAVGSNATVNGILAQWSSGAGGISTLPLGSLTPGQTATITYTYDTAAGDSPVVLSNTAQVTGIAAYTKNDAAPVAVNAQDSASITTSAVLGAVRAATPTPSPTPAVLAAAKTGEASNQNAVICGIALLAAAGGMFIIFRIRRTHSDNKER